MDEIRAAIPKLVKALSPQGGRAAAEAILTTDTRTKEAALRCEIVLVETRERAVSWVQEHLGPGDVVLYENDLPDHFA